MQGDELPPDWRHLMVEMIRGAEPLSGVWFTGGPVCTPLAQIEIYADQYRMRLGDALLEEIPGTRHLLGDAAGDLVAAYLKECPSRSFTLNRIADTFAEWLSAQTLDNLSERNQAAAVDMARLDRAVQHGFEAADAEALDPSSLTAMPPLALQPHVSLLTVDHNVHEIRSAILTRVAVPELRPGHFAIVVYRKGLSMQHWVVPAGLYGLLDAIAQGASVAEAVEDIHGRGLVDAETLATEIGGWFQRLAERKLLTPRT